MDCCWAVAPGSCKAMKTRRQCAFDHSAFEAYCEIVMENWWEKTDWSWLEVYLVLFEVFHHLFKSTCQNRAPSLPEAEEVPHLRGSIVDCLTVVFLGGGGEA